MRGQQYIQARSYRRAFFSYRSLFFLSPHDFIPGEKEREKERGEGGRVGAESARSPVKTFALKLCNLGRKFAFELSGKPRLAI